VASIDKLNKVMNATSRTGFQINLHKYFYCSAHAQVKVIKKPKLHFTLIFFFL
jgi:hypothetical protein